MPTNVTRQLCASVYHSPLLGESIIKFAKNPFNAIVRPPGVDASILLKHALHAKSKQRTFYWLLFVLSLATMVAIIMPPILLIGCLVLFIIVAVRDSSDRRFIRENFKEGKFDDNFQFNGGEPTLLKQLEEKTTRNIVYYSGYSPFVGCGYSIGGWSFVIDIDKGKIEIGSPPAIPKAFQEDELYYVVSKELQGLKIENFSIENKVYFNGKKIRNNIDLLPDIFGHPVTEVSSEFIKNAMNSCIDNARFYKMIQVMGWDGDLILMAFLRFQKGEKTLFVENNYYLLPPIKEEYRAVDKIKQEAGLGYYIKRFMALLLKTVGQVLASVFFVMRDITEGLSGVFGNSPEAQLRKTVKISPDYDYGSQTSIREVVCQDQYFQHFQKLDKERYFKTIDKRILSGLADFLDSKGISTVEFREREAAVLNNGIIVTGGGTLNGTNIATGPGATISNIKNFLAPKQGKKG